MLPALTLLVFLGALGAWSLTRPTPRTLLLGGGILAATQITGSLIALGLLGQLSRLPVIAVNAAASLLLIVLTRKSLLRALRELLAGLRDFGHMLRRTPALAVATAVLLLAMLWTLWLGLVLPPTDWDGLAQNLPMAAFHVQNGDIAPIETPYRGIRAYPQGGALLLAYTMLLSGSDTAVDLVQFPFWLMGTLAVYALARELAASRANAPAGALLFAAAPVVMLQARTAYFDLEVAAIALAALALLLDRQVGLRPRAVVAGAAAGLLAGLKYAGLIYALVLLVLLVLALVVERIPRRTAGAAVAGYLGAALVLGGCWYAWNIAGYQNPLWPMQLDLGGRTILPGVWTSGTFYEGAAPELIAARPYLASLIAVWREPTARYAADVRLGGLGPLWLTLGLPALLLFTGQMVYRLLRLQGALNARSPEHPERSDRPGLAWLVERSRRGDRTNPATGPDLLVQGGLLLFILVTFLLTPANWHTRYVLAPVGATGACVAVMLEQFARPLQAMLRGLAAAFACLMLLVVPVHGAGAPVDVIRNVQLPPDWRRTAFMADVPTMNDALRWAEQNIPAGSPVLYGWEGVILYPLFGPGRQNELHYFGSGVSGDFAVVRTGSAEAAAALQDAAWTQVFASGSYLVFARADHE